MNQQRINDVNPTIERDRAVVISLWTLRSASNPDAVAIPPEVKLENYMRNIVNIREIINNRSLFSEELSETFIQAHQKSLEIWEEKLERLYEEHPELRENNKADLIEPTVPETYEQLQKKYEHRTACNKYYESVVKHLKNNKKTAERLELFLQSTTKLMPEHKDIIRKALQADGSFDFNKALKEIDD